MARKTRPKKKTKKSTNEMGNSVHVKLDMEEALKAKKDILNSQKDILKIYRRINRYKELRVKEIDLKAFLYKKIKETKSLLKKLRDLLPRPEIPEIAKKDEGKKTFQKTHEKSKEVKGIESQLLEIQRKLNSLQNQQTNI